MATFANTLFQHLDLTPGSKPGSATIKSLFDRYQSVREVRVRKVYQSAHLATRLMTWDTSFQKILAQWILPWRDDVAAVSVLIVGATKVDSIPTPARSKGFLQVLSQDEISGYVERQRTSWDAILTIWALLRGAAYLMAFALQRMSLSLGIKQ